MKMDDLGVPLFLETPISTGAGFLPSTVVLHDFFCQLAMPGESLKS